MQCGPVMYLSVLVLPKFLRMLSLRRRLHLGGTLEKHALTQIGGVPLFHPLQKLPSHHLQELFTVIILNHAQVFEVKGNFGKTKVVLHIICMSNIIYKGLNTISSLDALQQLQ